MNEVNQNVFKSEQLGKLYFHEHVEGQWDCDKCALYWKKCDTFREATVRNSECLLAACCRGEREDGRAGWFSMVKENEEA